MVATEKAGRGTDVILHLKDSEKKEFTNTYELREIVRQFSDFLETPIYLVEMRTPEEEEEDEPAEGEEAKAEEAEEEKPEHPQLPAPPHLNAAAQKQYLSGQQIFLREGYCVTCHQANGKGLDPAFPSLAGSPWVTEDSERLIKLTLYGLTGPLEVNGKKYDGQVPMTPFGGMLNDNDVAAVLTFVRNSFGNNATPIQGADVQKVRVKNPGRMMLYNTEELLKEHPLK